MLKIIFLHGALLGGWVWQDIVPVFQKIGYTVRAPDLPGRSGKDLKDINLDTHIKAVSKIIEKSERPIVLVAHSMSGIVANQLAEKFHSKIQKVIFVSAYAPANGESLKSEFEDHFGPLAYDKDTMSLKIGKQVNVEDLIKASFHDCPEEFKNLVRNKAISEPIRPSLDKLKLSKKRYGQVKKSFIKLENDKVIPPSLQDKIIKANNISEVHVMNTGHSPYCASPQKLSKIILNSIKKI